MRLLSLVVGSCLALAVLGCGEPVECETCEVGTSAQPLPGCDPESGCGGGGGGDEPTSEVRVDVSYENKSASAIAMSASASALGAAWNDARILPGSTGIFVQGVVYGQIGQVVTFSAGEDGRALLTTAITPRSNRVHCRATFLGGGGLGVSCSEN